MRTRYYLDQGLSLEEPGKKFQQQFILTGGRCRGKGPNEGGGLGGGGGGNGFVSEGVFLTIVVLVRGYHRYCPEYCRDLKIQEVNWTLPQAKAVVKDSSLPAWTISTNPKP